MIFFNFNSTKSVFPDFIQPTSAAQFSPRHLCLECNHDHHVTGQNGGNLLQWRHIRENVDPRAQLKIINMKKKHAPLCFHGSHIFGLTNIPDFSSIFFPFSSVIFDEFNKYKNLFCKYTSIKKSEKK